MKRLLPRLRTSSAALISGLGRVIGPDEIHFWGGLALVAVGLWFVWWPAAFLVSGAVLLWHGWPTRAPFIDRSADIRRDLVLKKRGGN